MIDTTEKRKSSKKEEPQIVIELEEEQRQKVDYQDEVQKAAFKEQKSAIQRSKKEAKDLEKQVLEKIKAKHLALGLPEFKVYRGAVKISK